MKLDEARGLAESIQQEDIRIQAAPIKIGTGFALKLTLYPKTPDARSLSAFSVEEWEIIREMWELLGERV